MIIHIVYRCEPGRFTGGVSKMVLELASAQAKQSDVQIWTVNSQHQKDVVYNDRLPIRFFPGREFWGVVGSNPLFQEIKNLRSQITVLHGHNTFHPLNRQLGSVASKLDFLTFFNPHGALDPALFKGFGQKQIKKKIYASLFEVPLLNQARGVFALTPLEKQQLQEIGVKSTIHVVPNGIEPIPPSKVSTSLRQQLNLAESAKIVLFMGRISEKKNLETALQAFQLLSRRIDDPYFVVAGDENQEPAYSKKLRQLIEVLQIADRVKWIGFVDEKLKASVFQAANAFIHTSFSEGMAMSILESMIQGIPVVATRGCYMFQAAQAGGLLEVDQDPTKVADALYELLANPAVCQQVVSKARNYIAKHHQWDEIAKRMLSIYNQ